MHPVTLLVLIAGLSTFAQAKTWKEIETLQIGVKVRRLTYRKYNCVSKIMMYSVVSILCFNEFYHGCAAQT